MIIFIYVYVYLFPKQVSDCRGSGALKRWVGTAAPERPRGYERK